MSYRFGRGRAQQRAQGQPTVTSGYPPVAPGYGPTSGAGGYGPVSGPPGYGPVSGPPGYGPVSGPPGYGPGPGYGPPPPGYPAGPPPPPPPRSAPAAVHVVAVLYYLAGLVLVLGGVAAGVVSVGSADLAADLPFEVREAVTGYGIAIAALMMFVGFLVVALGRRLQRGKRWARMFVLMLSGLSLAWTVVSLVRTGTGEPLTGVVLPVLNLILLNIPSSRAWYRRY
jgi:hypothetical protein